MTSKIFYTAEEVEVLPFNDLKDICKEMSIPVHHSANQSLETTPNVEAPDAECKIEVCFLLDPLAITC